LFSAIPAKRVRARPLAAARYLNKKTWKLHVLLSDYMTNSATRRRAWRVDDRASAPRCRVLRSV
jgi:hypothetical protein